MDDELDSLLDALIDREGGYVNHPADKGGPTCFGITEGVARAHGYRGAMRQLPRAEAVAIYKRLYWLRPRFDQIALRSPRVAAELFDTGVNMGPAVAATFLQRALTALNRNTTDYADLTPDGRIGAQTLAALDAFLRIRGKASGEQVLLRALEALQANATCAWPSAAQPTKRSSTAGSRTGSVSAARAFARVASATFCDFPSRRSP
ncbi:hypothetical protein GCM10023325_08110 [Sphingomonas lutea]